MIGETQKSISQPMIYLVLASASPRRAELLHLLGIPFDVRSSHVSEDLFPGDSPLATVERLALAKARAVASVLSARRGRSTPNHLVLGADTLVVDEQGMVGKPRHLAEAVSLLGRLRGRKHEVTTGVAVVDQKSGATTVRSVTTLVQMRAMNDDEIRGYVASGDPLDKAGGYAIQNRAFHPVASIHGCYTNVVGLPLCVVTEMLVERGADVDFPPMTKTGVCACAHLADWIQ